MLLFSMVKVEGGSCVRGHGHLAPNNDLFTPPPPTNSTQASLH